MKKIKIISAQLIIALECMLSACGAKSDKETLDTEFISNGYVVEKGTEVIQQSETEEKPDFENRTADNLTESDMKLKSDAVIFSNPEETSSQLGTLSKGAMVKVLGQADNSKWRMISYNGRIAYISSESLDSGNENVQSDSQNERKQSANKKAKNANNSANDNAVGGGNSQSGSAGSADSNTGNANGQASTTDQPDSESNNSAGESSEATLLPSNMNNEQTDIPSESGTDEVKSLESNITGQNTDESQDTGTQSQESQNNDSNLSE